MKKPVLIAYCQVSTKKQGQSGLGLDAQRTAVEQYASEKGARILKEFTEVESGRKTDVDRPPYAKRAGAMLVVAKLDRLARNVAFLSRLLESGTDFVCCDNQHANRFNIHILAAVAEWEREQISARTKAALAQAKARGVKLGSARPGHWKDREDARRRGGIKGAALAAKVHAERAMAGYADLRPRVQKLRDSGKSLGRSPGFSIGGTQDAARM